jgi:ribosome-associated protein
VIRITPSLTIPSHLYNEEFILASGPGGQNVNKTSTAVQLRFRLDASALDAGVKQRIRAAHRSKLTQHGELIILARRYRSQERNRDDARERLATIIQRALTPPKKRRATRPTRSSKEKRLDSKKRHSDAKKTRRRPRFDN